MDAPKNRFFLNHKKSSALVVSIIIHTVFLVAAVVFVAIQVVIKEDTVFEARELKRPSMKLRKLQVPVKMKKRSQAPKMRQTIVVKPQNISVDIKMPEIVGIKGSLGCGTSGGLVGVGFNFEMDLFGRNRGTGKEFIGILYDLKQSPEGRLTEIGERSETDIAAGDTYNRNTQEFACRVIKGFVGSGFNEARLKKYFKAPKRKYATSFIMPPMTAESAPQAFDVEDQVRGSYWICHYKGTITAPETGRYRFCGIGDDVLVVRIGRRVVLDACWPELIGHTTSWKSQDDNNRKFPLDQDQNSLKGTGISFLNLFSQVEKADGYNGAAIWGNTLRSLSPNLSERTYMIMASRQVIGDWIELKKGQPIEMDVLIGEIPGGNFKCRLLIEQQGRKYTMVQCDAGLRPVLPIFKTAPINEKMIGQMQLDPNAMTVEGPVFAVSESKTKPYRYK